MKLMVQYNIFRTINELGGGGLKRFKTWCKEWLHQLKTWCKEWPHQLKTWCNEWLHRHKTQFIRIILILIILGVILWKFGDRLSYFWTQKLFPDNIELESFSDDQRSTLWPMFVSLVIAMLGSLITTYVFLKDALDHTLSEKPYYRTVVDKYRQKTMKILWAYAILTLAVILVTLILYFCLYFSERRSDYRVRIALSVVYCIGMLISFVILHRCIHIEDGLHKEASCLLEETLRSQNYSRDVRDICEHLKLDKKKLLCWLQIEDTSEQSCRRIDAERFVSQFSRWESLLLMLIKQESNDQYQQVQDEQLKFTIKSTINVYQSKKIEWTDAKENDWYSTDICKVIQECENLLQSSAKGKPNEKWLRGGKGPDSAENMEMADRFIDEFLFLARCRDLLQCLMDLALSHGDSAKPSQNLLEDYEDKLADIFFSFLIGLSVAVFRISPKIEAFFPTGRFWASDFYSIRFENSSFRTSAFTYAVFARTKVKNSNFSLSKFQSCEFFSADFRDCSFSNTLLESSFLRQAAFYDTDFTGTLLRECDLLETSCYDSILLNMELIGVCLGKNELKDCKIENILLQHPHLDAKGHVSMRNMNFSNSSISKIRFDLENWPASSCCQLMDCASQALQRSVAAPALQRALCFGAELEECIAAMQKFFQLDSNPFFSHPAAAKAKNEVPTHPVWEHIHKLTFISMQECVFDNTMMAAARFYRADLEQSIFRAAQMDGAILFCVYMFGCIMSGANLRTSWLWAVVLQSAKLEDAILFRANCRLVNFEDGALQHLHASEAEIQYCSFSRSDCSNIDLTKAKISDSLFWDSILSKAELTGAHFQSVEFDNSIADEMLASYTLFQWCSLSNAYLAGSNFNYTTFEDCDFRLANFSRSIVTSAVFRRCDFSGSNFQGTIFINLVLEDCSHLESAKFDHCQFISPQFCGTNSDFREQLEKQGATICELEEL